MFYLALKSLHVISVVLFLGNIITGVFWKVHADLKGDLRARAQALDGIIKSDRFFTLPGVFAIIITGVWMAFEANLSLLGTRWIAWSLVLFGISGICFGAFVAPLQKKLLVNVQAGVAGTWDEAEYKRLSSSWTLWGTVSTTTPLMAVVLMVMKPD